MRMDKHEAFMRRRSQTKSEPQVTPTEAATPKAPLKKVTLKRVSPSKPNTTPAAVVSNASPISEPSSVKAPKPARPVATEPTIETQETNLAWDYLREISLSDEHLYKHRIISAGRQNPAHVAFDVLRTRLLAALREHGWRRIAVTSPTKNCGKTFVSANLALSFSRHENLRTVLMDMDLRNPSVAPVLGVNSPGRMSEFLYGNVGTEDHFIRIGQNSMNIGSRLALGLNDRVETYAAEILMEPTTERSLNFMYEDLDPDVVIFDMPPALYHDDVMAFRAQYDGVLLVVGGGTTTAKEVRALERNLGTHTPVLGVVLNQAEGLNISNYSY